MTTAEYYTEFDRLSTQRRLEAFALVGSTRAVLWLHDAGETNVFELLRTALQRFEAADSAVRTFRKESDTNGNDTIT